MFGAFIRKQVPFEFSFYNAACIFMQLSSDQTRCRITIHQNMIQIKKNSFPSIGIFLRGSVCLSPSKWRYVGRLTSAHEEKII